MRNPRRRSWVERCLEGHDGPVIASTDYMRNYADQVRECVQAAGRRYVVLGTDGFGRSDYRAKLRRFFEGAAVALHGPSNQVEQETDEDGEFLMASLPKGEYCLEVGTPGRLMSVAPLDIE